MKSSSVAAVVTLAALSALVVTIAALSALVVTIAAAAGSVEAESAAACNPSQLTPCAGPVLFGGPVPLACCDELGHQLGCLCWYARSPNYGGYVHSPNARRLFDVCRISMPRCA